MTNYASTIKNASCVIKYFYMSFYPTGVELKNNMQKWYGILALVGGGIFLTYQVYDYFIGSVGYENLPRTLDWYSLIITILIMCVGIFLLTRQQSKKLKPQEKSEYSKQGQLTGFIYIGGLVLLYVILGEIFHLSNASILPIAIIVGIGFVIYTKLKSRR